MSTPKSHFLNLANTSAPTKLFFGERLGIFDTIHPVFPEIDQWGKRQKALDWDERDIKMPTLRTELEQSAPFERDQLIDTIAWQWETDTQAARMLLPILAPFISYDGLARTYGEIQRNENVHGATYSEITRNGFENPSLVLRQICERQYAFERLRPVSSIFDEAYEASLDYARGVRPYSQELATILLKFLVAVNVMENTQFGPSFSVAAFYNLNGKFVTATENIQRIAQDEMQVHVPFGQCVLDLYMRTEEGLMAFLSARDWIISFINQVVDSERQWNTEVLFRAQESIQGKKISHSRTKADRYVIWQANKLERFFRIDCGLEKIEEHPIPWIEPWLDISSRQSSPQELRSGAYLLGELVRRQPRGPMHYDLGPVRQPWQAPQR